ncbi:MAG: fibronectin type III domain-containing protein, partial [Terriglobus sp.]
YGMAILTAVPLLLTGCASEGPLHAPSLHLPAAVRGLSAQRIGNAVDLAWTNPVRTTDSISLQAKHGPYHAELCRAESFTSTTCIPFGRIPAEIGARSSFHDVLPADLAQGPDRPLVYRIRLINNQGKGAGWTTVATVAGAAPTPITGLQASPVANGTLIRWNAGEDGVMLRVWRGTDDKKSTLLSAQQTTQTSASGTIDTGSHHGEQQRYTVFRRRTVQLAGNTFTMDSDPATVTVSADAKLPLPMPPTNLEALANTLSTPEVDLVWQPPNDPGVTGYRVYRQESGNTTLLTPEPLRGFTYADKSVPAGRTYSYVVASVNTTGEQRSAPVTVTLP